MFKILLSTCITDFVAGFSEQVDLTTIDNNPNKYE